MTETNTAVDGAAEDVNEGSETTDTTSTEEGNSQNESGAEGEAADEDEEIQDDADEEPPTRKPRTNADWVALRRQQKLDKAKKAGKDEQGEADEDDSTDEDEDEISDEDAKLIDKRIEKHLAPLKQKEAQQAIQLEIDEFVAQNPDFKPFAAKALKWAQHPSWKDVPTQQLMYAAAGDKLLVIGAKRAKAAADKAAKTKTGTNSGGETGGRKSVADMTDEEFEQEIQRVKTQTKN